MASNITSVYASANVGDLQVTCDATGKLFSRLVGDLQLEVPQTSTYGDLYVVDSNMAENVVKAQGADAVDYVYDKGISIMAIENSAGSVGASVVAGRATFLTCMPDGSLRTDSDIYGSDSEGGQSSQPVIDNVGSNSTETHGPLVTIDFAHHEIHEGNTYNAFHSGTSKGDGQTINIYLKTPNVTGKWIHMFARWGSSGAAYLNIYEAPTITDNTGTHVAAVNRNRNSGLTSSIIDNSLTPTVGKYSTDVTKTGNGTQLQQEYSGAAKQHGGEGRDTNEWILDQNTEYCFEVESDAAGLTLNLELSWYEHVTHVSV